MRRQWQFGMAVALLAASPVACGHAGDGDMAPSPIVSTFVGPFSGQIVVSTTSGGRTCESTRAISGSLTMRLEEPDTWSATTTGTYRETSFTQASHCSALTNPNVPFDWAPTVSASGSNLSFTQQRSSTSTTPATVTATTTLSFAGTRTGDSIAGTLTYTDTTSGQNSSGPISGSGSTTMAVAVQKQ